MVEFRCMCIQNSRSAVSDSVEADREQGGKNKTVSHPDGRSRCRTLLVTVTEADEFADGKLEKTWLERAASARRPRGDQRRRYSDVGGAGGERYCFYLHRRGDGSWCTDVCGWCLGAARRGWLAGTAAQFPDVAVTPYHPACPPPESQWSELAS